MFSNWLTGKEALRQIVASWLDDFAVKHGRARRQARRAGSKHDLLAWGRKYLPDHFRKPPSNMHA
jgi:hypothetical protein